MDDLIAELRELFAIEGRPLTVGERARAKIAMSEAAAIVQAVEGADEALLISMATCLNHGFGSLSPSQQESKIHDMRKVLDEVAGRGYCRPENRLFYLNMRNTTDPLEAIDEARQADGGG